MSTLSMGDPKGPAGQRHDIEVYFPNVYDEETAKEVRVSGIGATSADRFRS